MSGSRIPLRIRMAGASDAAVVARLAGQLGYPSTPGDITRRLADQSADSKRTLLVAEAGGNVIGWILLAEEHSILHEPRVEILGLVVDEEHRGGEIGRALIDSAERWARERGCGTIMLRSNVIRERAHRFYERLGYAVVKSQKVFSKALQ